MAKLSIFFLLCSLSMVLGNYYYYPGASAGALSYMPYAQYGGYVASYPFVAEPECEKKEKGEESSSSESSSEESSSSESSEEGEKKEKKEKKEEKKEESGSEESKEGEEKEEGEEKKEGEEKEESSSSSSSSSEESKEKKEKKEKKKEKKEEKKEEKSLFPPRTTYVFPEAQRLVYAQPTYQYMQPASYKTYSVIQSAPVSYPVKSAYVAAAPYAGKGYASPVTKIVAAAPAARIVSVPGTKSYSPISAYYSPTASVLGMPNYYGNNLGIYKA